MEQVPGWLEAVVFAAGITAYAEEVERLPLSVMRFEVDPAAPESPLH